MQQLIKNQKIITKQEVRNAHVSEMVLNAHIDTMVKEFKEKALEHISKYGYCSNGVLIEITAQFI